MKYVFEKYGDGDEDERFIERVKFYRKDELSRSDLVALMKKIRGEPKSLPYLRSK